MGATIRCRNCGAASQVQEKGKEPDRCCEFCNAVFHIPDATARIVVQKSRRDERERRFAELRNHSSTEPAPSDVPSADPIVAAHDGRMFGLFVAFGWILMIAGLVWRVTTAPGVVSTPSRIVKFGDLFPFGFFSLLKIATLLFIGKLLFSILRQGTRSLRILRSPIRSWPACVIDQSIDSRGQGDQLRTVTLLMLEDESGHRESYEVDQRLARQIARDDMGIAHARGDKLMGFARIDV